MILLAGLFVFMRHKRRSRRKEYSESQEFADALSNPRVDRASPPGTDQPLRLHSQRRNIFSSMVNSIATYLLKKSENGDCDTATERA
jgi:hypothetical protein